MENRTGFGPRLGAYLLDLVLVGIISAILAPIIGFGGAAAGASMGSASGDFEAATGAATGFLGGLMAAMAAVYVIGVVWFLLEGLTGFTIGKLIVGIRIGNDDGTKAGIGKLMLRYVIKNISFLFGMLAFASGVRFLNNLGSLLGLIIFIGCFFVLGAKKQAFHDMIAKTAVYKKSVLK